MLTPYPPTECPHCAGNLTSNNSLCPAHLESLKLSWYGKLKSKGFKDIEQEDNELLKTWSSRLYTSRINGATYSEKEVYYHSVEEYYRLAGHFLYEYPFQTSLDRFIWQHHSEGKTISATVALVRKSGIKSKKVCNKRNIHETIQRLCKKMIAQYSTKKT